MRVTSILAVASAATLLDAKHTLARRADACPAVWTEVSSDLTKLFVQSDGQCNDAARSAIRAVFHDCGTWSSAQGNTGGCDGSLILSAEENARPENKGLQSISTTFHNLATQRGVGVADLIMFAGAHATLSCPLGPTTQILIGRKDSSVAAPENLLPGNASMSADTILTLFADKGFSGDDVAALIGAHATAKQYITDPAKAGQPLDRTPGIWDVDYYNDTLVKPEGVFILDSDVALANHPKSSATFKSFIGQQTQWNSAFVAAFARFMLLGNDQTNMVDCTSALPPTTDSFPGANLPEPAPAPTSSSSSSTSKTGGHTPGASGISSASLSSVKSSSSPTGTETRPSKTPGGDPVRGPSYSQTGGAGEPSVVTVHTSITTTLTTSCPPGEETPSY